MLNKMVGGDESRARHRMDVRPGQRAEVLRERLLASAVSLKDGKWAIVGAKTDSVQIEGGKVRIKVFEAASRAGR